MRNTQSPMGNNIRRS